MEKIIGDFNTIVKMTPQEAQEICNLGKGESCCAFLVCAPTGFECIRMDYSNNATIFTRLDKGTMNAKGQGGWRGCAWEGIK